MINPVPPLVRKVSAAKLAPRQGRLAVKQPPMPEVRSAHPRVFVPRKTSFSSTGLPPSRAGVAHPHPSLLHSSVIRCPVGQCGVWLRALRVMWCFQAPSSITTSWPQFLQTPNLLVANPTRPGWSGGFYEFPRRTSNLD